MSFSTDTGNTGLAGVLFLSEAAKAAGLSYHNVTQSGTELRIYPELTADGLNELPIRTGREPSDVGSWVCHKYRAVDYIGGADGKPKLSTLIHIKGDDTLDDSEKRGLRVWETIRNTLYSLTETGNAPDARWYGWVKEARDAVFGPKSKTKAKLMAFIRGAITGKMTAQGPSKYVSRQKPQLMCIIGMKSRAVSALQQLVMEEYESAVSLNTQEWDKIFKNNGVIGLDTGRMLQFHKPGTAFGEFKQPNAGNLNFSANKTSSKFDDDDAFNVAITVSDVQKIPVDIVRKTWQLPWDKALRVHSDETAMINALSVGLPDDLLAWSFRDTPNILPDRLKQKLMTMQRGGSFKHAAADNAPIQFNFATTPAEQPKPAAVPGGMVFDSQTAAEQPKPAAVPGGMVFDSQTVAEPLRVPQTASGPTATTPPVQSQSHIPGVNPAPIDLSALTAMMANMPNKPG